MNKLLAFIGLVILFSSCRDKITDELLEFTKILDDKYTSKATYLQMHYHINSERYAKFYRPFRDYNAQSQRLKDLIDDYLLHGDKSHIDIIFSEFDTLIAISKNLYKPLDTKTFNSKQGILTHFSLLEALLKPTKQMIEDCKSNYDMQVIKLMLYKIDLEVLDFLFFQAHDGLKVMTDCTGPVMIQRDDSAYFYLSAFDSTIADYIAIGDFESIEKQGERYIFPIRIDEKVYFKSFTAVVDKRKIFTKELMYVTLGPAGDTIRKPVQ